MSAESSITAIKSQFKVINHYNNHQTEFTEVRIPSIKAVIRPDGIFRTNEPKNLPFNIHYHTWTILTETTIELPKELVDEVSANLDKKKIFHEETRTLKSKLKTYVESL